MKKIVMTGGGTAGHIIPALALIPELKKHDIEVHFIGGNGMEKELVTKKKIPFYSTTNIKLDRQHLLNNIKIPYKLHLGVAQATKILQEIKPDAIFSKGGYASLPTCLAGKKLKIPVIVHESDFSFGVANKIVKKFACLTLTSFPETGGLCLGNPIREEIFLGDKYRAIQNFPIDNTKQTVLVFGGSLGAKKINEVIYTGLDKITETYNLIHISGKSGDLSIKHKDYFQLAFSDDIADLFALADIVVARAGANTLAELSALNKKAVIIPLPKGNSRGDQAENAKSYKKMGYFEILPQSELYVETLLKAIFTADRTQQKQLIWNNPNKKIVEKIIQTVDKH